MTVTPSSLPGSLWAPKKLGSFGERSFVIPCAEFSLQNCIRTLLLLRLKRLPTGFVAAPSLSFISRFGLVSGQISHEIFHKVLHNQEYVLWRSVGEVY